MNAIENSSDVIIEFLQSYFQTRKTEYKEEDISCFSRLVDLDILSKNKESNTYKLNMDSISLHDSLYNYIESCINQNFTSDIIASLRLVDFFKKQEAEKNNYGNIINAYSELIEASKAYILIRFHSRNELNVVEYYNSLSKKQKTNISVIYLHALLYIEIPANVLYRTLNKQLAIEQYTVASFCLKLGKINSSIANKLFDYILLQGYQEKHFPLLSNILIGLYEGDEENIFIKAKHLIKINTCLAYITLGRLNYTKVSHIKECFSLSDKVNPADQKALLQIPYLYQSLIANKNTPDESRRLCFRKLEELFLIENEDVRNAIFQTCSLMNGYEAERCDMLMRTFLPQSISLIKNISHYFIRFEDPDYFFDCYCLLYQMNYKHRGARFDVSPFQEAFSRYWRTNKNDVTQRLLSLLSQDIPHIRLGAMELIRTLGREKYSSISLLSLDSDIKQLRAIEAILFFSYYDIESLLNLILPLIASPYQNVVAYIQSKLSMLIFESYHDHLYIEIEKRVLNTNFLLPLKKSLEGYHQMLEYKTKINDLNPYENERDYLNFYYRVENEQKQKMLRNAKGGGIFDFVKETAIIRGNSWKVGDNEVSPLGKYEHSTSIDMTMYKNPDLFDFQKTYFKSEY